MGSYAAELSWRNRRLQKRFRGSEAAVYQVVAASLVVGHGTHPIPALDAVAVARSIQDRDHPLELLAMSVEGLIRMDAQALVLPEREPYHHRASRTDRGGDAERLAPFTHLQRFELQDDFLVAHDAGCLCGQRRLLRVSQRLCRALAVVAAKGSDENEQGGELHYSLRARHRINGGDLIPGCELSNATLQSFADCSAVQDEKPRFSVLHRATFNII